MVKSVLRPVSAVASRAALSLALGALALAACNAKNAYVPPPPPKVVVAQPLQQPVTLYFELTGNTAPFSFGRSRRPRPGLSANRSTTRTARRSRRATQLFGIERDQSIRRSSTRRRRRSPPPRRSRPTTRPNTSGRRRSAARTSPPRPRSSSGSPTSTSRAPRSSNAKASIELASINLGYTQRRRAVRRRRHPSSRRRRRARRRVGADQARDHRPDRPDLRLFQPERAAGPGDQGEQRQGGPPLPDHRPLEHPGRDRAAGRGRLSAQGAHGLRLAAGRPVDRHAARARGVRQQGPDAAARACSCASARRSPASTRRC